MFTDMHKKEFLKILTITCTHTYECKYIFRHFFLVSYLKKKNKRATQHGDDDDDEMKKWKVMEEVLLFFLYAYVEKTHTQLLFSDFFAKNVKVFSVYIYTHTHAYQHESWNFFMLTEFFATLNFFLF